MSFRFYPTLENRKDLTRRINMIDTDEFCFFSCNEFGVRELAVSSGKIKDSKDIIWDYQRDSLRVCRDLKINNPEYLFGKEGVAPQNSKLGICVNWSNEETALAGCILPQEYSERHSEAGWSMYFEHTFARGEIKGHLDLKILLYLKEEALELLEGEKILNNTAGRVLGELESYRLEVSDATMPFPFAVDNYSDSDALWWVDFSSWDDPAEDALFGPSSFVVYLNSKYRWCPKVTENGIQKIELLNEIVANVYTQLFKKLSAQQFTDMQLNKGRPGTISAELHRVYQMCKDKFDYQAGYENINKTIQEAISGVAIKDNE